ncbi:sugar ABC transporter permease [Paenibacillus sp. CF384]|uniref:ABC transporter permease n=1 Tax=Paenibacillus sp. CF384 TaxID=1884382 RepID=UPI0008980BDD|nr:ABC transporter permease subunit [Paenibacillus sp. CF384]SDW48323.1 putative aldouronate transport system permease protein [Paenibacillus sp. CF384]
MKIKQSLHYHAMLLPGIVILLIFSVYPMFGIVMAFESFNPSKGFWGSRWVGLENFHYMFEIPDSYQVFKNTIFIAFGKIIANLVVSLFFALILNELRFKTMKRVIQTIVYLPHFISWVLLGGILAQMFSFDGIVNQIGGLFGAEPVLFMGNNHWFPTILIGSDVWKEFGFSAIVFIAALTGINPSLYESAAIDGAGRWQRLRYVTIPGISTTVVLITTLALQNVLNAGFEQILNLYNPVVYQSADIIDTYVYRVGLIESQFELATAVGLLKSIVSFILIVISYRLAARYANYRIF